MNPSGYGNRLMSRAWKETQAVFNAYRWWIGVSSPLFTVGLQALFHGWSSLRNAGEVTANAIGGCAVAFAGCWAISVVRTIKLLDNDRANEVQASREVLERIQKAHEAELSSKDRTNQAQAAEIEQLRLKLQKPVRTAAEDHYYREAEAEISKLSGEATIVLRHIYAHGQLYAGPGLNVPGLQIDTTIKCLNGELATLKIVRRKEEWKPGVQTIWWEITPGYRDALGELLFQPDTPAQKSQ